MKKKPKKKTPKRVDRLSAAIMARLTNIEMMLVQIIMKEPNGSRIER